jgi:hypothetical protein
MNSLKSSQSSSLELHLSSSLLSSLLLSSTTKLPQLLQTELFFEGLVRWSAQTRVDKKLLQLAIAFVALAMRFNIDSAFCSKSSSNNDACDENKETINNALRTNRDNAYHEFGIRGGERPIGSRRIRGDGGRSVGLCRRRSHVVDALYRIQLHLARWSFRIENGEVSLVKKTRNNYLQTLFDADKLRKQFRIVAKSKIQN